MTARNLRFNSDRATSPCRSVPGPFTEMQITARTRAAGRDCGGIRRTRSVPRRRRYRRANTCWRPTRPQRSANASRLAPFSTPSGPTARRSFATWRTSTRCHRQLGRNHQDSRLGDYYIATLRPSGGIPWRVRGDLRKLSSSDGRRDSTRPCWPRCTRRGASDGLPPGPCCGTPTRNRWRTPEVKSFGVDRPRRASYASPLSSLRGRTRLLEHHCARRILRFAMRCFWAMPAPFLLAAQLLGLVAEHGPRRLVPRLVLPRTPEAGALGRHAFRRSLVRRTTPVHACSRPR